MSILIWSQNIISLYYESFPKISSVFFSWDCVQQLVSKDFDSLYKTRNF
jgi:hypothetical protein